MTSGVPQGSVLGPLLFLIMMTDIDCNIFNATIGSFADDTRLWNMVTDKSSEDAMQKELEIMYQWAERNNMQYNGDKFEGMRFGNQETKQSYLDPNQQTIKQKNQVKDLGILIITKQCNEILVLYDKSCGLL